MARRIVIALIVVALLVVGAALLHRQPPSPSREAKSSAERRGTLLTAAISERARRRAGSPAVPSPTGPSSAATQETPPGGPASVANLATAAAAEYRRRAQYPPWSRPIETGAEDPILRDREVSPNVTRGPNGSDPSLVTFPDQVSFEAPDPVVLYAYLSIDGTPVAATEIDGEVADPHGDTLTQLQYNDDGRDGDPSAGDHIYTATIDPRSIAVRLDGTYAVRVHAATTNGDDRYGSTGFLYSNPDAQLTGRYSDSLVDGNLRIDAEVEVSASGRFHIAGSLYTQDGSPLAWAQNAQQLGAGVHTLPLTFFGRILRQKAAVGPYILRFVALSTTTEMPNSKNRLVENAYVTQSYSVDSFGDAPYNDRNLLETAERLDPGPN
ncbi:MAG TPA: hypothetical protein VMT89_06360 [Candidatus Acidoferrales bacterium]|nr:hypothetical protein [Candidatus Acidoferrales bacterium]